MVKLVHLPASFNLNLLSLFPLFRKGDVVLGSVTFPHKSTICVSYTLSRHLCLVFHLLTFLAFLSALHPIIRPSS